MEIVDEVSGFQERAQVRWRLAPELTWTHDTAHSTSDLCALHYHTDGTACDVKIIEGWESLYYLERTALPILELTVTEPTCITTRIELTTTKH